MPSLIIIRGLPGSGKSSLASQLSESGKYPVYSIDDYFTDSKTGEYKFEFEKNHLAYKLCEENTLKSMQLIHEKIFIDNCFTLEWELEPYIKLAAQHHYRVHVITVENRHEGKNVHEIPLEQIKKMAGKFKVVLY